MIFGIIVFASSFEGAVFREKIVKKNQHPASHPPQSSTRNSHQQSSATKYQLAQNVRVLAPDIAMSSQISCLGERKRLPGLMKGV